MSPTISVAMTMAPATTASAACPDWGECPLTLASNPAPLDSA